MKLRLFASALILMTVFGSSGCRKRIDDTLDSERVGRELADLIRLNIAAISDAVPIRGFDIGCPGWHASATLAIAEDDGGLVGVVRLGDEPAVARAEGGQTRLFMPFDLVHPHDESALRPIGSRRGHIREWLLMQCKGVKWLRGVAVAEDLPNGLAMSGLDDVAVNGDFG